MTQKQYLANDTMLKMFDSRLAWLATVAAAITDDFANQTYHFMDMNQYLEFLEADERNYWPCHQILWSEIVQRHHLVCVTSLIRTRYWLKTMCDSYDAANLLGWCAGCRGFLESTGDMLETLPKALGLLSMNWRSIRNVLDDKKPRHHFFCKELEEILVHFTEGRHISKMEKEHVDNIEVAKSTVAYIKNLRSEPPDHIMQFYGVLCETIHPARESIFWLYDFGANPGGFSLNPNLAFMKLQDMTLKYRGVLDSALMAAMNAPLLSLKALSKFSLLPRSQILRNIDLSYINDYALMQERFEWRSK